MTILKLSVPSGDWRPNPFPGDDNAITKGCVCPRDQTMWPQYIRIDADCPVHEMKPAQTDATLLQIMGTDAQKWAFQFCRRFADWDCPKQDIMRGWFANAIEAGRAADPKK